MSPFTHHFLITLDHCKRRYVSAFSKQRDPELWRDGFSKLVLCNNSSIIKEKSARVLLCCRVWHLKLPRICFLKQTSFTLISVPVLLQPASGISPHSDFQRVSLYQASLIKDLHVQPLQNIKRNKLMVLFYSLLYICSLVRILCSRLKSKTTWTAGYKWRRLVSPVSRPESCTWTQHVEFSRRPSSAYVLHLLEEDIPLNITTQEGKTEDLGLWMYKPSWWNGIFLTPFSNGTSKEAEVKIRSDRTKNGWNHVK